MPPLEARVNWARHSAVGLGLLVTLGLIGLHLEYYRHAGPLWRDEVNSVNVATMPSFGEVFANSQFDSFPVAWVTVLHAWTAAGLGDTDAGLRRLGLLIGLAMIAVLWWTGRGRGRRAPLVALVLFGMSPTTIVYGDEVRGYGLGALGVCWYMGAAWAFVEKPTWKTFLVAELAALLAVQAYFANCFLVLAICAGAAATCRRRRAWRTLAAVIVLGALAAVSTLVNLPTITRAFRVGTIEQGDYRLGSLVEVFRYALAPGVPRLAMLWAAAAVLALIGCGLAWRFPAGLKAQADKDRALFVAVTVSVGLVGYCCYLQIIKLPTQYWYYLSLMALIALGCDVGICLLVRRFRAGEWMRSAAVALAALLVASSVAETVAVRMTNLDLIARKLEESARPEDLIVVFPWYCGITFQRYYRGPTAWITLPDFEEHRFHTHTLVAEKMKQGDAGIRAELERVERTLRQGGRVWIVGAPVAPPAGQPPPRLPPAPTGPQGWRAGPYLDGWELQLGALLQAHGADTWRVSLPDPGPVNTWENLPLLYVEGWR